MNTRSRSTSFASLSLCSLLAISTFSVACDDGPTTADFPPTGGSAGQSGTGGTSSAGTGGSTQAGGAAQAGGASSSKGGSSAGGTGGAGGTGPSKGGSGGTGGATGGSGGSGGSGVAGAGGTGVGGSAPVEGCNLQDPASCGKGFFCADSTKTCGKSGAIGTCSPIPQACPAFCQSPGVCGCDGQRYCNNCEAAAQGVSLADDSFCGDTPTPVRACGSKGLAPCFKGEFCDRSDSMTCGEADEPGVCKQRPTGKSCPKQCVTPGVCGCDGQRYCNECQAEAKGVSVAPSDSYCAPVDPPVRACGSKGLAPCFDGEFCDRSGSKTCGEADEPGVCAPIPDACTKECQTPGVCGCDGQRYCSACAANQSGVSAAPLDTYCPTIPTPKTCGGFTGATCAQNEYCLFPADAGCGFADGQGTCVVKETKCDTVCTTPICGCDGQYYCNTCALSQNGVSAAPDASYCKK